MDIISPEKENILTPKKNQSQINFDNYNSSGKMSEEQQNSDKKEIKTFYSMNNKENEKRLENMKNPKGQDYFISSTKKLSWSEYVRCPYNKSHIISEQYMIFHLCRCPDKTKFQNQFEICPFNSLHRFPVDQLEKHFEQCPDLPENFNAEEYFNMANVDWSDHKFASPEFYDFENTWMPEEEKQKLRNQILQNISNPEKLVIWETQQVFYSQSSQTECYVEQQQQISTNLNTQIINENTENKNIDDLMAQMLQLQVNKQLVKDAECQTNF